MQKRTSKKPLQLSTIMEKAKSNAKGIEHMLKTLKPDDNEFENTSIKQKLNQSR